MGVELTEVVLLKLQTLWSRNSDRDFENHALTLPVIFARVVSSF